MLPKKYRFPLRQHPSFFHTAKKKFFPGWGVFFEEKGGEHSQVVVVVPKKVAAKATRRNFLKRKIYQELSLLLPYSTGKNVVIILRKNMEEKDFPDFQRTLQSFLHLSK